ncbi:ClC family H(+)/Cl(-) exchange transporter [Selenomonas sp.]|uniref:ClC family H(+)/Cl(-) exchange transporter n=2 Tax=Selenomonas sp. TaxID=2053611 RepID=UPI002A80CAA5|nr:ClC family H(+)/Cl(-) exchange transporter [Selenomonas sp.]MDY4417289.1 ClC family H(+)/Cl(-) exchange transporter [Selenomonas sp.]
MRQNIVALLDWLAAPERMKLRLFLEGNLIGVLTGFVIAAFRYLLVLSEEALPRLYAWLAAASPVWTTAWCAVLAAIGYVLYRIVRHEPMTSGSGIPQIEGILAGEMQMNWARVLAWKFIGAVLGIGAGLSLGREGPSVQLGACLGQGVGRMARRAPGEDRYLLTAGAGAGLAAAFNAPLAGVIFCLEELTKDFSPLVLMGAVAACVTATTVVQQFFGLAPVFHMGDVPVVETGSFFLLLVLLGLFVGFVSLAFNRSLTFSLDTFAHLKLPAWSKPMLPLFVSVAFGFALPQVLGGGSPLVDSLVVCDYGLTMLCVLFAAKFLFLMVCFGSGVPGGIFLPMLVLGALAGAIFARLAALAGVLPDGLAVDCMVFGMAAYFACVVKSPITGTVLIMEMTGSFAHMLPLILVSMTAYLVSELTGGRPVYEMLLSRSLAIRDRARARIRAGSRGRRA